MKVKITTKYNVWDKVYQIVEQATNIVVWKIDGITIGANYETKKAEHNITYSLTRKKKIWLLKMEIIEKCMNEEKNSIEYYSTKEEALLYIKKVKEAKEIIKEAKEIMNEEKKDYYSLSFQNHWSYNN